MTTYASKGIAIGAGGSKKKGTTIAATLPSDFYKNYQPPRAPRIQPMREGPSSLVTMAEMSLPDTAGSSSSGLSGDLDSLDLTATRTGTDASSGAEEEEEEEAKPLHSMSLRDSGLAMPKTMPSTGLTTRGGTATADAEGEATTDSPMKVGSLTAMDLMKMAPSAGLKTRRFGDGLSAGRSTGSAGAKGDDSSGKSSDGAAKKKKPKTQFAMEEDSESESEEESG